MDCIPINTHTLQPLKCGQPAILQNGQVCQSLYYFTNSLDNPDTHLSLSTTADQFNNWTLKQYWYVQYYPVVSLSRHHTARESNRSCLQRAGQHEYTLPHLLWLQDIQSVYPVKNQPVVSLIPRLLRMGREKRTWYIMFAHAQSPIYRHSHRNLFYYTNLREACQFLPCERCLPLTMLGVNNQEVTYSLAVIFRTFVPSS